MRIVTICSAFALKAYRFSSSIWSLASGESTPKNNCYSARLLSWWAPSELAIWNSSTNSVALHTISWPNRLNWPFVWGDFGEVLKKRMEIMRENQSKMRMVFGWERKGEENWWAWLFFFPTHYNYSPQIGDKNGKILVSLLQLHFYTHLQRSTATSFLWFVLFSFVLLITFCWFLICSFQCYISILVQ